ncbi:DUF1573 domain-containing protein [Candidatus Peregrinibacteria bacterium]|nr:DUF1573 domain-containing protein [Candidatus Peregrinibacteria bacterium]
MKKFLIILAISGGTIGILWLQMRLFANSADSQPSNNFAAPSIVTAAETSFDFGKISMAKGKVNHEFSIKNSSPNPVTIQKLYSSCMCTTASLLRNGKTTGPFGMPGHGGPIPTINEVLQPGEEASILAVFDPAAHGPAGVGPISRSVFAENNASGTLKLDFQALVTP